MIDGLIDTLGFRRYVVVGGQADWKWLQTSLQAVPIANFREVSLVPKIASRSSNDVPVAILCANNLPLREIVRQVNELRVRGYSELVLIVSLVARVVLERELFAAGFRKHPHYYDLAPYEALVADISPRIIAIEAIPEAALVRYPLCTLAEERNLHMDMLRESGERSDAHVYRYAAASKYIRHGDVVLDAACGLGYGTHFMAANSPGTQFIGFDGSPYAIEYATENYRDLNGRVNFREAMLPGGLDSIPDASVDLFVTFETLEHVAEPEVLLRAIHRVLKPGGRIIVSVPNDWADESGKDPNPHHLHVYTFSLLESQLNSLFIPEKLWAQTASGCKDPITRIWQASPRRFRDVAFKGANATPAEWWVMLAMKSPIQEPLPDYCETVHPYPESAGHLVDFSEHYENPHLLHSLVEIPYRLSNASARIRLAKDVLEGAGPESADRGAALAVLGYGLLSIQSENIDEHDCRSSIEEYLSRTTQSINPHVQRWRISLWYLAGKLALAKNDLTRAEQYFEKLVAENTNPTPTLGTKTVDAYCLLGRISWAHGQREKACAYWREGVLRAKTALRDDWSGFYGDLRHPLSFAMNDAVELLDRASVCTQSLAAANLPELAGSKALGLAYRNALRSALDRLANDMAVCNMRLQSSQSHNLSLRAALVLVLRSDGFPKPLARLIRAIYGTLIRK
jgi:SAM-dependent methyltransferase